MRHPIVLSFLILTMLFSCTVAVSDKEVEREAYAVIDRLDKNTIDTFRHWGYGTRGDAEIWSKLDTPAYVVFYWNNNTREISVGQFERFKQDFPYSTDIDTNFVRRVIFKKLNAENINVAAWTNFGRDTILADAVNVNSLFLSNDPFNYFAILSELKDDLGIIGTSYRPYIGNFIQFYLTNQHVLTYFPDNLQMNPKFEKIWMGYFSAGKTLSKNWNLRKLETPLDNG